MIRRMFDDGKEIDMIDEKCEKHPSFGTIQLSRMTAMSGVPLFNSPMRHGRYVRITVTRASLVRAYHTDWIHPRMSWSR